MLSTTERQQIIESYGQAHAHLVAAIEQFPVEMWQARPAGVDWTIHEIIVHITDSEASSFARCRKLIAEPGATVMVYDEAGWAKKLDYHSQSTADALELFKWLRLTTYKLIKTLPESTWAHTIEHPENGTMSMDDWLQTYHSHIHDHIAQMQGVYEVWKNG